MFIKTIIKLISPFFRFNFAILCKEIPTYIKIYLQYILYLTWWIWMID